MTGEEFSGAAGPKVLRLLYFVGAGFVCTFAINKWQELTGKRQQQQQQRLQHHQQLLNSNSPHDQASLAKPLD